MSALEATYRRALRWYPKRWRTANEDALIGTLLDLAEEERRTEPGNGELRNLRSSGFLARFGFIGRAVPRPIRGRASILTFGLGVAISVTGLVASGWTWGLVGGSYAQMWTPQEFFHSLAAGQGVYLLWIAAFVTAVLRLGPPTSILLLLSIPLSIAWPAIAISLSFYGHPSVPTLGFLDLLAALSFAGHVARQTSGRRSLAVSAAVATLLVFLTFWLRRYGGGYWGNGAQNIGDYWGPLAVWLVLGGLPLALVLAVALHRLGRRAWSGGILLAASPLLPLALAAFRPVNDIPLIAGAVAMVAIVLLLAVGILRLFGLRLQVTRAERPIP